MMATPSFVPSFNLSSVASFPPSLFRSFFCAFLSFVFHFPCFLSFLPYLLLPSFLPFFFPCFLPCFLFFFPFFLPSFYPSIHPSLLPSLLPTFHASLLPSLTPLPFVLLSFLSFFLSLLLPSFRSEEHTSELQVTPISRMPSSA